MPQKIKVKKISLNTTQMNQIKIIMMSLWKTMKLKTKLKKLKSKICDIT